MEQRRHCNAISILCYEKRRPEKCNYFRIKCQNVAVVQQCVWSFCPCPICKETYWCIHEKKSFSTLFKYFAPLLPLLDYSTVHKYFTYVFRSWAAMAPFYKGQLQVIHGNHVARHAHSTWTIVWISERKVGASKSRQKKFFILVNSVLLYIASSSVWWFCWFFSPSWLATFSSIFSSSSSSFEKAGSS